MHTLQEIGNRGVARGQKVSNAETINTAMTWLNTEAGRADYAEIGVRLIIHAGQVVKVERSITTKEAVK